MRTFIILSIIALASAGKVDDSLLSRAQSGRKVDAILQLPSISKAALADQSLSALSGDAKVVAMVNVMTSMAAAAQAPFLTLLNKMGVSTKTVWVANQIGLYGVDLSVLEALQALDGDFVVREEKWVFTMPAIKANVSVEPQQADPQWGVDKIRAPAAHAVTKGEGVVVGIIDTGAKVSHVALKSNFAGAWSDPYYSRDPTDANGHGSHALGSIVGTENGIGVAPGATWVACRGLNDQGSGSELNLNKCAEWMLTADPRPRIVSNSWGGGSVDPFYDDAISAWRAAGIIPVFAIGNSGASCRTAISPGDRPNVISVAATTTTDALASFSSRGASGDGKMKPEVAAPGNAIVSVNAAGDNGYTTLSGTSMATPHVAGAIALILSANPTYDFDQVLDALVKSATQPTLTNADRNCGVSGNADYPNNAYGAGRIDVGKALGV